MFTLCSLALAASTPQNANNPFYLDAANMLDASSTKKIDNISRMLWRDHHICLMLVTIPSLEAVKAPSDSLNQYAMELINELGLESQANNREIILLIDKQGFGVEIQLGKSWESNYRNETKAIINKTIMPYFQKKNYAEGILQGFQAIDEMVRKSQESLVPILSKQPYNFASSFLNKLLSLNQQITGYIISHFGPAGIIIIPIIYFIILIVLPLITIAAITSYFMPQHKKTIWYICGGSILFFLIRELLFSRRNQR